MNKYVSKLVSMLLVATTVVSLAGCGGSATDTNGGTGEVSNSDTSESGSQEGKEGKTDIVVMFENADEPVSITVLEMVKEHFPQYNIVSKQWTGDEDVNKTVKSTFSTDSEALDIVMYNNSLSSFVESGMALDLTPYLEEDEDFAGRFVDGALTAATNYIDGHTWGIPYSAVYPLVEVNTAILEEAGVEYKDAWTWEEFIDACEKIKANTDAFPAGCQSDWAPWFAIQACNQAFDDEEEYLNYCLGNVSFTDERILKNMDKVAALFNEGYMYPGNGAISVSAEEVQTAFANSKVAMRFDVNSIAQDYLNESGLDLATIKIGSFPTMANDGVGSTADRILGGNNVFFIPSNTKNPEAAVEILKYLFSDEVQTAYAESGTVIFVNLDSDAANPEYAKDFGKMTADLIYSHSAEMLTYINGEFLGDYLNDPDFAIETIEEIREGMIE